MRGEVFQYFSISAPDVFCKREKRVEKGETKGDTGTGKLATKFVLKTK